jgi:hypothetical protein
MVLVGLLATKHVTHSQLGFPAKFLLITLSVKITGNSLS